MEVRGDQDYKWQSKLSNVVLRSYTPAELQALKTQFIADNDVEQDGRIVISLGEFLTWDALTREWVPVSKPVQLPPYQHEFLNTNLITANHNLHKYPAVLVKDSSGNIWIPKGIEYPNVDTVVITFDTVFSGIVFLS